MLALQGLLTSALSLHKMPDAAHAPAYLPASASAGYQHADLLTVCSARLGFGWDDRPNGTDRLTEAEAWLLGKDR